MINIRCASVGRGEGGSCQVPPDGEPWTMQNVHKLAHLLVVVPLVLVSKPRKRGGQIPLAAILQDA